MMVTTVAKRLGWFHDYNLPRAERACTYDQQWNCERAISRLASPRIKRVHGGRVQSFENRFGERSVTQVSRVKQDPSARMVMPPGLDFDYAQARDDRTQMDADAWGDATYHGPSIMYYYTESRSEEMSYQSWWVNYHIPVNDEEVDLCSSVIVNSLTDEPLPQEFVEVYPRSAHAAFGQDVEIWKDKVYQAEPILCDGDGPINKLRKWYEQFYLPR